MIGDQSTENVDKMKIDKNPDSHLLRSASASCLDTTQLEEDMTQIGLISSELKDLFQSYCSYGEPTNTVNLKSAKLQKMVKDAGLLVDDRNKSKSKVTVTEVDLMFTIICQEYFKETTKPRAISAHATRNSRNSV